MSSIPMNSIGEALRVVIAANNSGVEAMGNSESIREQETN
jgi:hypothetical protein